MLRSKLGYFDSCFTAREVLRLSYEHQCKILDSDSISAYVQTIQPDDLLLCEERGFLEQPLIALG